MNLSEAQRKAKQALQLAQNYPTAPYFAKAREAVAEYKRIKAEEVRNHPQ